MAARLVSNARIQSCNPRTKEIRSDPGYPNSWMPGLPAPSARGQTPQADLIENQMPLLQFNITKLSKICRLLPRL